MNDMLQQVINRNDTWRGHPELSYSTTNLYDSVSVNPASGVRQHRGGSGLVTGYSTLDSQLHQGGWPTDGAVEVLSDGCGLGAMGLFLPAMEQLSAQQRWQVFIAPPYIPYAPLLEARGIDTQQILLVHPTNRKDLLWATEQALRSTACSAVFSWLGAESYRYADLRKLQLAAADSDSLAVLFRSGEAAREHAPASLRLAIHAYRKVHILKQRGGNQGMDIELPTDEDIPGQPQLWELPTDVNANLQRSAVG